MTTFTLKINCDNDAFVESRADEVANILRQLVDALTSPVSCDIDTYTLRDSNGNAVGKAQFKGE